MREQALIAKLERRCERLEQRAEGEAERLRELELEHKYLRRRVEDHEHEMRAFKEAMRTRA